MSGERIPVPGITRDSEPNELGNVRFYWPDGTELCCGLADWIAQRGVEFPEPRVGRLGLNEADTKAIAGRTSYEYADTPNQRFFNAGAAMCAEDVALWNKEDRQASRPPTPLGLSEADVRYAADRGDSHYDDRTGRVYTAVNDACRAWVAAVDGAS